METLSKKRGRGGRERGGREGGREREGGWRERERGGGFFIYLPWPISFTERISVTYVCTHRNAPHHQPAY